MWLRTCFCGTTIFATHWYLFSQHLWKEFIERRGGRGRSTMMQAQQSLVLMQVESWNKKLPIRVIPKWVKMVEATHFITRPVTRYQHALGQVWPQVKPQSDQGCGLCCLPPTLLHWRKSVSCGGRPGSCVLCLSQVGMGRESTDGREWVGRIWFGDNT